MDVDCGPLEPPAGGTCAVTQGNDSLLIQGTLLGPNGLITGGSVKVSPAGIIECVGCDCAPDGATVVNCGDAVVSPGLINAHDHITFTQNSPGRWGEERYDHRHDWRRGIRGHNEIRASGGANNQEVWWGELRQLIGGTTSLAGSGGADGLLRNLDRNQEGLNQGDVELDTFPLGDTGGQLRNGNCDYPDLPNPGVLNEDAWSPHVSEGIDDEARNEFICLSSMDGVDVTGANGAFIHGVGLTAVDGAIIADRQTAIIWSPRSNISLYGHTAPVTMLDTQGVLLGLGTDWTPSGSINMQRELACADRLNRDHYNGYFSDRDLWLMATANNARALAVADGTGSLQVGLTADIAVFGRGGAANPYRAVIEATPATTALVLRSGAPLYGDGPLVAGIPDGGGCEEVELCETQKRICLQGEIGQGFGALEAANAGSYALTFCGVPPDEPTCIPSRPAEFDGMIRPDDGDGDGVVDAEDNCPTIFNPVRPLDGVAQADHDGDGLGDVCDVCPIDADTDECTVPDPGDRDADGVPEVEDNCPGLANPDQADADEDGKGDLCDPCPVADPAGQPCPGTIQQIKRNAELLGASVQVEGVVTAIQADGGNFFVQMPDDAVEDGPGFSGMFVFVGNATVDPLPALERGQSVRVTAQFNDFFGQRQLARVSGLEVLGDGALPTIALVESAEIATDGALAAAHEGTLVRIVDATVTAQNPPAGPGDRDPTNSIVVDEVLRINDLFFALDPLPAVGVVLPSVTGVLRFANGDSKLEPRDAADINQGPPALLSLAPDAATLRVGETRAPTSADGALTIRLTAPAPEEGLPILVTAEPEGIAMPQMVRVAAGELSAPVPLMGEAAGVTTVSASLPEGEALSAEITVIPADQGPGELMVAPEMIEVLPGAEFELTFTADVPAPFEFNDADDFNFEPMFAPGAYSATATLVAPMEEGEYRATLQAGAVSATAIVRVSAQPAGADLVINEVDYDQPGQDGAEFAEIFNPTGVAIPLAGVVFEAVNGSNGQVYGSYDLSDAGAELPAGGYLVLGNAAVNAALPEGVLRIALPNNGLQNGGPDGVRIVRNGEFVDGVAYEGGMDGVTEGDPLDADSSDRGEGAIARCANGADTDNNAMDFVVVEPTPGAQNACE